MLTPPNLRYSVTEKQYIEAMIELEASRAELKILEDMAEGLEGLPRDPQILKYVSLLALLFSCY